MAKLKDNSSFSTSLNISIQNLRGRFWVTKENVNFLIGLIGIQTKSNTLDTLDDLLRKSLDLIEKIPRIT